MELFNHGIVTLNYTYMYQYMIQCDHIKPDLCDPDKKDMMKLKVQWFCKAEL